MARSSKIWTSEEVKMVIEKMKLGGDDVKETPFFNNDPDLKGANVSFTHTPDELIEFVKCSQDCVYFTSKYCNFLTDKGRRPVVLRDYQEEILDTLTKEKFIDDLDDYGPVNRNVIMMASRQTGKCIIGTSKVYLGNNNKINIMDLYKDDSIIFKIKKILYKLYEKL